MKGAEYQVLLGDCVETLQTLPAESVHTCVTSPPYFGLRDYGHEGQVGLEATPDEFVEALVRVFREVRRVLRDDGTLWLILGDSYAGGGCGARDPRRWPKQSRNDHMPTHAKRATSIKPKNLLGMPWRVAFALQADGWYLRQDIIWNKPNPMPESVSDRCTKGHEYVFLLSKQARYYYDADAIKEPAAEPKGPGNKSPVRSLPGERIGENSNIRGSLHKIGARQLRSRRSVWTVSTRPYAGAHFATFPPDLIEPCILAGCAEGGTVLDPFAGSGTTAGVALHHGRNAVLCELSPAYAELIPERVDWVRDYLATRDSGAPPADPDQFHLFDDQTEESA